MELITVSVDAPFAQKRFDEEAKIPNVAIWSAYRGGEFEKTHGPFLEDPHMLTSAL